MQKRDKYCSNRKPDSFMVPKLGDVNSYNLFAKLGNDASKNSRMFRQSMNSKFLNTS